MDKIKVSVKQTPLIYLVYDFGKYYFRWNIIETPKHETYDTICINKNSLLACLIRCITPDLPGPDVKFQEVGKGTDTIWRHDACSASFTKVRNDNYYEIILRSFNLYIHPSDCMITVVGADSISESQSWNNILEFKLPALKKMLRFVNRHKEK